MPVTNKERKQQARNINTQRSWREPLTAFIVAIAIFVIGFVITLFNSGGVTLGQRAKFEGYLNDKYGQEFVVENVRVTGAGLGGKGSWIADAYPESDSSLRFKVRKSQITDEVDYEAFLEVLWTKQGVEEVRNFLTNELPDNEHYYLKISPGTGPGSSLYASIQGETPSLSDVIVNNKNAISYELVVNDIVQVAPNEPSSAALDNAMKLVNFVRAKGIKASFVSYGYRDPSFTERNHSGQQKYQYRIKLEREALQKINSSSDLRQYFEVIKY